MSCKHVRGEIFSSLHISTLCLRSFSVTRDALPLFSGERWPLETGWGLLACVKFSFHRDTCPRLSPQDYDSLDMKQRRCSSPGYIDSPTYSRQGMSPIMPRSPQHYGYLGESTGCHPSGHRNFINWPKKWRWWRGTPLPRGASDSLLQLFLVGALFRCVLVLCAAAVKGNRGSICYIHIIWNDGFVF